MSIDRSLREKDTLRRHRNVLTRAERVERLKELGIWEEDACVFGLPKVIHRKASVGKKVKEDKEEATGESTGAAAATGTT